jgi:hypothetical protein
MIEKIESMDKRVLKKPSNLNPIASCGLPSRSYGRQGIFGGNVVVCCLSMFVLSLCPGCGGNLGERLSLGGSVTFDGQPLERGSISFNSVGEGSNSTTGGAILNGEYSIAAERGLIAGAYRVSISAADTSNATPAGLPATGQFFPSLIPPEFNDAKHQVVVTEEGPNDFDFDIKKSN